MEKSTRIIAASVPSDKKGGLDAALSGRFSKELVISLCGPAGCGIADVERITKDSLEALGYQVVSIKVSDLIIDVVQQTDTLADLRLTLPQPNCKREERIKKLQEVGNQLRARYGDHICAALAVREISIWRERHQDEEKSPEKLATTRKTAFLINQLKHPAESALFSKIYGNTYYQLGILASEEEKVSALMKERIDKAAAVAVVEADRRQNEKHGQQLEKALTFSDYFIHSTSKNLVSLGIKLKRFIDLVHGRVGITPTNDEVGMNAAYTASLRSACLSRQVGAAICDKEGNVLSVGRNDVPKFGGGLYTSDDGDNDRRCVFHGRKCYNTEHIEFLKEGMRKILGAYITDGPSINEVIAKIEKETVVGSLIEFSRAIHAEMDAITSIARNSSCSTKGTTIYTTTYPCHNCARHIVAAGITRVVYIEPYAKSLAINLHDDAIRHDTFSSDHVGIEPFEGVAPRRHKSFFAARSSRKDSLGSALEYASDQPSHIDAVIVARYTETEAVVTRETTGLLQGAPAK